jgi:hypothetical protein
MSALLDEVVFAIIVGVRRVRQVSCQSSEVRKIKQLGGIEKSVPKEVQKFPTPHSRHLEEYPRVRKGAAGDSDVRLFYRSAWTCPPRTR